VYPSAVQLTVYPHGDSGIADVLLTAGCKLKSPPGVYLRLQFLTSSFLVSKPVSIMRNHLCS